MQRSEIVLAETTLPSEIANQGRVQVTLQVGQQIDAEWLSLYLQCSFEDAVAQLEQGVRRGQLLELTNGKYEVQS